MLRRIAGESISDRSKLEKIATQYNMDRISFIHALKEVSEQISLAIQIPDDTKVTVESWGSMVIIHTHWGLRINRTLSRILSKLLSQERRVVSGEDAYRVVVEGKGISSSEVAGLLNKLASMDVEVYTQVSM